MQCEGLGKIYFLGWLLYTWDLRDPLVSLRVYHLLGLDHRKTGRPRHLLHFHGSVLLDRNEMLSSQHGGSQMRQCQLAHKLLSLSQSSA
ncbi:hypothetical protein FGO68_gene4362 [Halteria grandinella]|uniref:Uncharacterized protein n=1 Tax=Halteria grandinella TaxID=5974 RepID=A0A8J8NHE2_HALGN|nr:hypothetical protein FGO68_gene4362 [Halteria grandinella]